MKKMIDKLTPYLRARFRELWVKNIDGKEYMTANLVCIQLKICRRTLYSRIESGKIKATKRGNDYFFLREDIQAYLQRHRVPHVRQPNSAGNASFGNALGRKCSSQHNNN